MNRILNGVPVAWAAILLGAVWVGAASGRGGERPGEGPLEAGGEPGAAPAPEARVLHQVDHLLGA